MNVKNHFVPRTRDGWLAASTFLLLVLATQPPVVYLVADNRLQILGIPFLYFYLLALYLCQIGILIWAAIRRV